MFRNLVIAGLVAVAGIGVASTVAAKQQGPTVHVVCEGGWTFDVWGNGNGDLTPAHVIGTHQTVIPVAFSNGHGTLTDPDGNVVEEFEEPPTSHEHPPANADLISCHYNGSETFDGYTFSFEGDAVIFVEGKP